MFEEPKCLISIEEPQKKKAQCVSKKKKCVNKL